MTHNIQRFAGRAIWALPVWAAMLFLGTLTHQPDPQTAFPEFAAYVTTTEFLLSHLFNSILGAAIGSIGVIAVMLFLQNSKAARPAIVGMVATVAANTLTSSIFGAAAFAQPAMGQMFLAGQGDGLDVYNRIYAAPLFLTAIISLLLFIIGGISTGRAIAISGRWSPWIGWMYAITTTGFVLSNFLLPLGQSINAALLVLATLSLAWRATREVEILSHRVETPAGD